MQIIQADTRVYKKRFFSVDPSTLFEYFKTRKSMQPDVLNF